MMTEEQKVLYLLQHNDLYDVMTRFRKWLFTEVHNWDVTSMVAVSPETFRELKEYPKFPMKHKKKNPDNLFIDGIEVFATDKPLAREFVIVKP